MSRISSSGGYKGIYGQKQRRPTVDETYLRAHLQLHNLNLVCYDRGLIALVESRLEHLNGIDMELVGETWPFERE